MDKRSRTICLARSKSRGLLLQLLGVRTLCRDNGRWQGDYGFMRSTRLTMKQYTTPEQTAKLIELGFEESSGEGVRGVSDTKVEFYPAFSIGELIGMLPPRTHSGGFDWVLDIHHDYKFERWLCFFNPENQIGVATELVDALYNLIIKLKEEGVI